MSTFALPAVAMVAFWWNDWPGSRLTTPWTGLIDTVLVVAAAVVLTIAGQAIVERSDIRGVFEATPVPACPRHFRRRWRWPARRSPPCCSCRWSASAGRWPGSGGSAPASPPWLCPGRSAIGAYFLFVNVSAVPAAERAAAGLRNPGGPIAAPDFGSALIAVGVWQAVFFIALRGWPVNAIARRGRRLLAGNALVLGLGALTYLVLRDLAHWRPARSARSADASSAPSLIVAMLFEGWPAARLSPRRAAP